MGFDFDKFNRNMDIANQTIDMANKVLKTTNTIINMVDEQKEKIENIGIDVLLPKSPQLNAKIRVMDKGVFWEDIENKNGWRLQKRNKMDHYRVLRPDNVRVAWGKKEEMDIYWKTILPRIN